jgi:hypothetical protein
MAMRLMLVLALLFGTNVALVRGQGLTGGADDTALGANASKAPPGEPHLEGAYYSRVGEEKYEVKVTWSDVEQTPKWAAKDPWPPMSPRDAVTAAERQLRALVTDPDNWRLRGIWLDWVGEDRWVYVVRYFQVLPPRRPTPPYGHTHPGAGFVQVVVLMNGETIQPIRSGE